MRAVDFIDSNVLVYALDTRDPGKHERSHRIVVDALAQGSGIVSFQVVQETLNALTHHTRPIAGQIDVGDVLAAVLMPLWHVHPSAALYERALQVQSRHRFTFYDSLIVAAALEAGCRRLLTEDLQHGQKIGALRIENPFAA